MGQLFSTYDDIKKEEKAGKKGKLATKSSPSGPADTKYASLSKPSLPKAEREDLAWNTHYSCDDVNNLYKSFQKLAAQTDDPDMIQKSQFKQVLAKTKFSKSDDAQLARLFAFFDKADDKKISFREYVLGLSVMCKGTPQEKFKLSFEIYDADRSGTITKENMTSVLIALNRGTEMMNATAAGQGDAAQTRIKNIVEDVFKLADKTKNGELTYAEYFKAVLKYPSLVDTAVKAPGASAAAAVPIAAPSPAAADN